MKQPILFQLLFISLSSISIAAPQASHRTQTAPAATSQRPNWTEADRKVLLAKAKGGDRGAQMWLGSAYEQGWFGEKTNFQQALKWYGRAAAQGDPGAQNSLGQMYEHGEGVQQNYSLAAKLYRRAAEHVPDLGGASQARNNLGMLYLDGRGVPKNYVQAYMWFRLADSNDNLSYAKSQMSSAQIVEAERMTAKWKSRHPEP